MATSTGTFVISQTTDAEFRTWIAGAITLITGAGITQTADTGQVDTATVTRPGVTNTSGGYAIFRFNDTLHGTVPIFFKVEFGTGSTTTTPSMWVTAGTGTDGAGTITGSFFSRLQRNVTASTTPVESVACYNTSIGMFWCNIMPSSATFFNILIARTCDSTGAPDDFGVVISFVTASATINVYAWASGVTNVTYPSHNPYAAFTSATILRDDDGYPVVFVSIITANQTIRYLPGVLVCNYNEFPPRTQVSATPHTTTRTYLAATGAGFPYGWEAAGDADSRALLIWE